QSAAPIAAHKRKSPPRSPSSGALLSDAAPTIASSARTSPCGDAIHARMISPRSFAKIVAADSSLHRYCMWYCTTSKVNARGDRRDGSPPSTVRDPLAAEAHHERDRPRAQERGKDVDAAPRVAEAPRPQSRQPGLEWQMLIKEIDVWPLPRINQSGCEQVQAL